MRRLLLLLRVNTGKFSEGSSRANSLRTRCAGAFDLWKYSPGRKLPDSKQKLQAWKDSWRKHTLSAGPIPHTFPVTERLTKSIEQPY